MAIGLALIDWLIHALKWNRKGTEYQPDRVRCHIISVFECVSCAFLKGHVLTKILNCDSVQIEFKIVPNFGKP